MAEVDEKTDPFVVSAQLPDMGIINSLLSDPEVSEIMINDLRNIIVEKEGRMFPLDRPIESIEELNRVTRAILDLTGKVLTPEQPYVDCMLPDGSRVNLVGPPLTLHGVCITIRKFPVQRFNLNDLVRQGVLEANMARFLQICVVGQLNLLVSGGTGSGKTTLLNALIPLIPLSERLISIEDTPELVVPHINSVKLQTKPPTPSSSAVSARDLVANALRMRPDRIIVGECRRAEAFDMLQAMNTGHDGSMTTLHANSPRDALSRLETLCLLSGVQLPVFAIRKQISSAIDLIIQVKRSREGKRKIISITEVTGMESETITLQDLWTVQGDQFKPTGFVPLFAEKLKERGLIL